MSKTLMSYPCPYYTLALFYILISALLPDCVHCKEEEMPTSRRPNVAMSGQQKKESKSY